MIFAEKYTTASIKSQVTNDPKSTPEDKVKENAKMEVSNDAFLNTEILNDLMFAILRSSK